MRRYTLYEKKKLDAAEKTRKRKLRTDWALIGAVPGGYVVDMVILLWSSLKSKPRLQISEWHMT